MVRRIFFLTVALVLQYVSVAQAAEPEASPRGNTTAVLAKLKVDLEQARTQACIPGMSVAIIHKGKLIFAEGFGKRNKVDPFTPETRSMIGSLTKSFTATAVAELVAEGKMDWDTTPVNTYLPEFETNDPVLTSQITMQDLLSHRTNMPNVDFNWFWSYGESRQDLIKRYRHIEVQSKMPVNVHYSNSLYGVAGEAAARVAGESYEHVVRNKVLRPLGLTSTGFSMPELISTSNFAIPYKARSYADAKAGRFDELPLDDDLPNDVAAGDIYSSALDLARWGQIVMKGGVQNGKQVLSKEGIAATLTAHTIGYGIIRDPDFGLSDQYGMGWGLSSYKGNNIYEHSGRTFGYMANLVMFPNAELVVAQVSNSDLTALLRFSAYHIADQVLGLRKSHDWLNNGTVATESYFVSETKTEEGIYPERIPNKPPTHELSAYAGKYDHPGFGTATIRLEGGKLHISFAAFRGVLAHYHYDSFTTVFEHVSVKMGELISFSTGADGRVSGVSFALFDTVINAKKEWN